MPVTDLQPDRRDADHRVEHQGHGDAKPVEHRAANVSTSSRKRKSIYRRLVTGVQDAAVCRSIDLRRLHGGAVGCPTTARLLISLVAPTSLRFCDSWNLHGIDDHGIFDGGKGITDVGRQAAIRQGLPDGRVAAAAVVRHQPRRQLLEQRFVRLYTHIHDHRGGRDGHAVYRRQPERDVGDPKDCVADGACRAAPCVPGALVFDPAEILPPQG